MGKGLFSYSLLAKLKTEKIGKQLFSYFQFFKSQNWKWENDRFHISNVQFSKQQTKIGNLYPTVTNPHFKVTIIFNIK